MKGLSFILVAAVGSLILFGGHAVAKAKALVSQVKVKFLQFGGPEISSNQFSIPVKLEVINPLQVPVPVSDIKINFFTKFQGDYIKIGEAPSIGSVTFSPGANQVVAFPIIYFNQVKQLFSTLNAKTWLNQFSDADLAEVRIDLILTTGFGLVPVTIPVYTRLNLVSIITAFV